MRLTDGSPQFRRRHLAWTLVTEMGPLLLFFLANGIGGIYWATGVLMVSTALAAAVAWRRERRLPVMPGVSLGLALLLGSLAILDADPVYVLIRPTLINGAYGLVLLASLPARRPLLAILFGRGITLTPEGWRLLSLRLGLYLLGLAALNELVWRSFSIDTWVAFKTFCVLPLNALFLLGHARFLKRYRPVAES